MIKFKYKMSCKTHIVPCSLHYYMTALTIKGIIIIIITIIIVIVADVISAM